MKHLAEAQAVMRENGFNDCPCPWIGYTAAGLHRNGAYADYAAWEKWMAEKMDRPCMMNVDEPCSSCYPCRVAAWWDACDNTGEKVALYGVMCDIAREVAEAMGWKDGRQVR